LRAGAWGTGDLLAPGTRVEVTIDAPLRWIGNVPSCGYAL
jgi:hypothetical protein